MVAEKTIKTVIRRTAVAISVIACFPIWIVAVILWSFSERTLQEYIMDNEEIITMLSIVIATFYVPFIAAIIHVLVFGAS